MSRETFQTCERCRETTLLAGSQSHKIPDGYVEIFFTVYDRDKKRQNEVCDRVEVCNVCARALHDTFMATMMDFAAVGLADGKAVTV